MVATPVIPLPIGDREDPGEWHLLVHHQAVEGTVSIQVVLVPSAYIATTALDMALVVSAAEVETGQAIEADLVDVVLVVTSAAVVACVRYPSTKP